MTVSWRKVTVGYFQKIPTAVYAFGLCVIATLRNQILGNLQSFFSKHLYLQEQYTYKMESREGHYLTHWKQNVTNGIL